MYCVVAHKVSPVALHRGQAHDTRAAYRRDYNFEGGVMKTTKKKLCQGISMAVLAGFMAGPTLAGKVNMPKEGSFAFDFCNVA